MFRSLPAPTFVLKGQEFEASTESIQRPSRHLTSSSSVRIVIHIIQGPGAREERRGLVACVTADGAQQLDRTSTGELHFEFYLQSAAAAPAAAPAAAAVGEQGPATEGPTAVAAVAADAGKLQVGAGASHLFLLIDSVQGGERAA